MCTCILCTFQNSFVLKQLLLFDSSCVLIFILSRILESMESIFHRSVKAEEGVSKVPRDIFDSRNVDRTPKQSRANQTSRCDAISDKAAAKIQANMRLQTICHSLNCSINFLFLFLLKDLALYLLSLMLLSCIHIVYCCDGGGGGGGDSNDYDNDN